MSVISGRCRGIFLALLLLLGALVPAPTHAQTGGGDKAIELEAVRDAVESLPADLQVPGRYALIVGADDYADDRVTDLPACRNDAQGLYDLLTDPAVGLFADDDVALLTGDHVTQPNVVDALDRLGREAGPDDLVIVFFSGHGAVDERGRSYWVMHDTQIDRLRATALPENEITALLGDIRSNRLVTLIDACYSASTAQVAAGKSLLDLKAIYPKFDGKGRVAMTASQGDQLSVVITDPQQPGYGYSAFAWHLIEGLGGKADGAAGGNREGVITVDELWTYVKDRTETTARRAGGQQRPQLKGQMGSRFLLTVDSQRLVASKQSVRERLAALKTLFIDDAIDADQFRQGRRLITSPDADLDEPDLKRRQVYADLAEGRLSPSYLQAALDSVETPEQRAVRLAEEAREKLRLEREAQERERQAKIAELLASARTNDSKANGRTALRALDELLKLDPNNAQARQLKKKIEDYFETPAQRAARERREKIAQLLASARGNDSKATGRTALRDLDELLRLDPNHREAKRLKEKIAGYYGPPIAKSPFNAAEAQRLQEATAEYLGVPANGPNSIGMELVLIPAGEFTMGSPASEAKRYDDERQHRVRLSKPFAMGVTEVTQAQWRAVMGTTLQEQEPFPTRSGEGDAYPMYHVHYEEALDFCRRLSQKEGKRYRLPTEAEWEYACRAGTTTVYHGGNELADLKRMGWASYDGDPGSAGGTKPVGSFQANAWGLYDMHGNVMEWCSDWYASTYPNGVVTNPSGPAGGERRVLRGGSWYWLPSSSRSAKRNGDFDGARRHNIGFRVVLDLD
ncbi:MAG: SUMF1/EgtB/PvdO family nonheme iron enzyme [Planctomycetota bacterium]